VAGVPITQSEFDEAAAKLDKEFKDFIATAAGRENFLTFLINERLLQQAAIANDIEQSDRYKREMEKVRKEQAASFKEYRSYLLKKLLIEKLQKDNVINVTEDEIKAYHRKYPYQITISHILMSDPQKASTVMREIANVKSLDSFSEYVRKFSIDPLTKNNKGLLSPFIPGEYLAEIEVPAANTPALQPQGFIKTPLGFHIIMKVKEESLSYNNAKDRIREILEKQKTDAYLEGIRQRYGVEVIKNETE
jgi:peptidyl-prolyl cis-trans isomerase C